MKVSVTTNMTGVSTKVMTLVRDNGVRKAATTAAKDAMEPRVPKDKGPLRETARALPTRVEYVKPYARHVYYLTRPVHWTTPGTGPLWGRDITKEQVSEIAKAVTDYLKRMG